MFTGVPTPLIKVHPADHQDGFFRTNVSLGRPSLPGGWELGYNATPTEGDHCLPFWAASFRGDQLVHMDCLKIHPTWMWDHRQVQQKCMVHNHHHKSLPFDPTFTQLNPVHISHSVSLTRILILSSHLHLGSLSGLLPRSFSPKILTYQF
jgi:hypothetical protein